MATDSLLQEALAHHRAGRLAEAGALYERLLAAAPGDLRARYLLGTLHGQAGRAEASARMLADVVARQPDFADAHNSLGVARQALGDLAGAEACYRQALALAPESPSAHNNLGSLLQARGDLVGAIRHLERAAALDPRRADALYNLGVCRRLAEDLEGAREAFGRARALRPGDPVTLRAHAEALLETRRPEEAAKAWRRLAAVRPADAAPLAGLGDALSRGGDMRGALAAYDAALEIDPALTQALAGKGRTLDRLGETEAAAALAAPELARDTPAPWAALLLGAVGPGLGRTEEALNAIERALAGRPATEERRALHFQAGGLYDREQAFDEAFDHYRQGNELAGYAFDPAHFDAWIDELIAVFDRERTAVLPRATHGSELPVFIVGMPRSGTTLTEQIIACHPRAHGAGELPDIGRLTDRVPAVLGGPYPACVARLTADVADRLAEPYLARLRALGGAALRVTDKMPHNYMHLGLMALLFPQARVLHTTRDPVDTCLSCYFQTFGRGLAYTFDLGHLGRVYRGYRRLMDHWEKVLGPPAMTVRYEALVADPEAVSREIVAALGLPWDDACLRPHESRRAVDTASYAQVRRPIYRSSVARWRHYQKHLGPLLAALGPFAP
jgi:tetratricopeptide (TPR) repeat protein